MFFGPSDTCPNRLEGDSEMKQGRGIWIILGIEYWELDNSGYISTEDG